MKNDGSAAGQRSFEKTWRRVAPIVRSRSVASPSVEANPSSSATVIGKNVTSTITITFGSSPKPNQITSSGAMRDDRDRLRADEQRIERPPDGRRLVHGDRDGDRRDHRDGEPDRPSRRPSGPCASTAVLAEVDEGRQDPRRRREHQRADARQRDVRLPDRSRSAITDARSTAPDVMPHRVVTRTARSLALRAAGQEVVREQLRVVGRRGQRLAAAVGQQALPVEERRSRPSIARGSAGRPARRRSRTGCCSARNCALSRGSFGFASKTPGLPAISRRPPRPGSSSANWKPWTVAPTKRRATSGFAASQSVLQARTTW